MLEMKDNRRNLINNLSISNLELDKRRPQKARKKMMMTVPMVLHMKDNVKEKVEGDSSTSKVISIL